MKQERLRAPDNPRSPPRTLAPGGKGEDTVCLLWGVIASYYYLLHLLYKAFGDFVSFPMYSPLFFTLITILWRISQMCGVSHDNPDSACRMRRFPSGSETPVLHLYPLLRGRPPFHLQLPESFHWI